MAIQSNIASGYLSAYEQPLAVSVMEKTQSWPFLQELTFAGSLQHQGKAFHGLDDFKSQMSKYSSTNFLLKAAYTVIQSLIPMASGVSSLMFTDQSFGQVGKAFQQLSSAGQVFTVSPAELKQPTALASKVSALS